MNTVIVLSGGKGTRMRDAVSCPKQYYEIDGKPIIGFSLETFERSNDVDCIVIVAEEEWHGYISKYMIENGITKFRCYAKPGETRQLSIYSGLQAAKEFMGANDIILVHDAARPLVSDKMISECFRIPAGYDGVMPILPVTDTMYQSEDGKSISRLLPRHELFKGQAPESFCFGMYLKIHEEMKPEEIMQINGSSEIAYRYGMNIALIEGDSKNIKITNPEDIAIAEVYLREK